MTEKPDLFLFDQQVREEGFLTVCGVDEAGRGPLAGSVVAAAVILPPKESQYPIETPRSAPTRGLGNFFK